jgi:hypothetical protein
MLVFVRPKSGYVRPKLKVIGQMSCQVKYLFAALTWLLTQHPPQKTLPDPPLPLSQFARQASLDHAVLTANFFLLPAKKLNIHVRHVLGYTAKY